MLTFRSASVSHQDRPHVVTLLIEHARRFCNPDKVKMSCGFAHANSCNFPLQAPWLSLVNKGTAHPGEAYARSSGSYTKYTYTSSHACETGGCWKQQHNLTHSMKNLVRGNVFSSGAVIQRCGQEGKADDSLVYALVGCAIFLWPGQHQHAAEVRDSSEKLLKDQLAQVTCKDKFAPAFDLHLSAYFKRNWTELVWTHACVIAAKQAHTSVHQEQKGSSAAILLPAETVCVSLFVDLVGALLLHCASFFWWGRYEIPLLHI